MKIYQFYSEWNDKHNPKASSRIRFDYNQPIPEKYRSHILDIVIVSKKSLLPKDIAQRRVIQIWYSIIHDKWRINFYPDEAFNSIADDKYKNTFKEIKDLPNYVPNDIFKLLIEMSFEPYYERKKELLEKYNATIR